MFLEMNQFRLCVCARPGSFQAFGEPGGAFWLQLSAIKASTEVSRKNEGFGRKTMNA